MTLDAELNEILENLGQQWTSIDSDHQSGRVDLPESTKRWKYEQSNALARLTALIERERVRENEWWIEYLEEGIRENDPDFDTSPSTTTKIFKLRIEKHKERISELTKASQGQDGRI